MSVLNQLLQTENYPREFFKSQVKLYLGSIQGGHDHSWWESEKIIYNKLNGLRNISNGKTIVCPSKIHSFVRMYDLKDVEEFVDQKNTELNRFLNDRDILYALSYSYYKDTVSWVLERENINLHIICKIRSWLREGYSVLGEKPFIKFMEFLDGLGAGEVEWKRILETYTFEEILWWCKADFYEKFDVKNIKVKDARSICQTNVAQTIHSHREYWQSQIYLNLETTLDKHESRGGTIIKLIQQKVSDLENTRKGKKKNVVRGNWVSEYTDRPSLKEIDVFIYNEGRRLFKKGIRLDPVINDPSFLEELSYSYDCNSVVWLLENENLNLNIICKIRSSWKKEHSWLGCKALRQFMSFLDGLSNDEQKWQHIVEYPEMHGVMLWSRSDFRKHFGV